MSKMPKRLSLNSRTRSTSKTHKFRDWEGMTHERNFSGVIGGTEKFVPKRLAKTLFRKGGAVREDSQYNQLTASIWKIDKGIKKQKALSISPDEKIAQPARIKLLKLEGLRNRQVEKLLSANAVKQLLDQREFNRHQIRQMTNNGELVRLNNNKLVPGKKSIWTPQEREKILHEREKLVADMESEFGE